MSHSVQYMAVVEIDEELEFHYNLIGCVFGGWVVSFCFLYHSAAFGFRVDGLPDCNCK
jgi:hypothetical protein